MSDTGVDWKDRALALKQQAALEALADPNNWIGNPEVWRDPSGEDTTVLSFAKRALVSG